MAYPAETHSGTVTSWIPLTTYYSPSAECSSYFRLEAPSIIAFDPGAGLVNPHINCQPSAVTTWWNQAGLGVGNTAVSLLPMICPGGWSTVETSISNGVSNIAMCCPSKFYLTNQVDGVTGINGNCASDMSQGQVLTYASTGENTNDWITATTTMDGKSYVGAIAVVGWNVEQTSTTSSSSTSSTSADPLLTGSSTSTTSPTTTGRLVSLTTSASMVADPLLTTNSTSTTSPTTTGRLVLLTTSTSTSNAMLPTAAPTSSDDLLTGARAGIGLDADIHVIGVTALVVAIWITLRRRKTAPSAVRTRESFAPYSQDLIDLHEPPKQQQQDMQSKSVGYRGVHELLHEEHPPRELPAIQSPVKLAVDREKFDS